MIVFFKSYVMNFTDFVLNCYSHITSHVSQAFTSFTDYTSYSLLNIVRVIMCVFGLTNQFCKYFEFLCKTDLMLENLWRMFENLNFGKTWFKTCVFENFASHIHAFYSYFSMLGGIYAKNWAVFQNCVFTGISIDQGYFSINWNWFKIFRWASVYFNQLNLRFWSIENRMRSFLKTDFQLSQTLFQKVL